MGHQNEVGVHVYARIAEEVSSDLGVDVDSLEVNAWIHDDFSNTYLGEEEKAVRDACIAKATEYGIAP